MQGQLEPTPFQQPFRQRQIGAGGAYGSDQGAVGGREAAILDYIRQLVPLFFGAGWTEQAGLHQE